MNTPLYPPQHPLSVGETLDLTFRIYRATLAKCLPLAALAVLVAQLPTLYLLLSGRGLMQSMTVTVHDAKYDVIYILSVLLSLALNAALLLRQHRLSAGQPMGGELAAGLRRVPALLVFVILAVLAVSACGVPLVALAGGKVLGALGVLLFLIALSYVIVSLSSGYAILVLAPLGPLASLRRSANLTRGSFWRLTAIYSVALVILVVLYFLLGVASSFIVAVVAHGDLAMFTAAYAVIVIALGSIAVPFYTAVQLAVLGDLTVRREGADLAQRISATA
jgi:hypothetical protein